MSGAQTGGCLCGALRFEISELMPAAAHCHCSMCRKFHGAGFATIVGVPASQFKWITQTDTLKTYVAANETTRSFCGECGSSLLFASPRAPSDIIEVALGVFDDDVPVLPDAHIFVESGAAWAAPRDGLPAFQAGRNSPLVNANVSSSSLDSE